MRREKQQPFLLPAFSCRAVPMKGGSVRSRSGGRVDRREVRQLSRDLRKEKRRRHVNKLLLLAVLGGMVIAARSLAGKPEALGGGTVTLKDSEPGALSNIMAGLMREYMKHPGKKAVADRMSVSIAVEDLDHPEMATTVFFKGSDVTVADGSDPGADIHIGMELSLLLSLARAPLGPELLSWLQSEDGQKIVKALKDRRLSVRGVSRYPSQMLSFAKFMAPQGT
jgi:hypothetical protein